MRLSERTDVVPEDLALRHAAAVMIEHAVFPCPSMIVGSDDPTPWDEATLGEPTLCFDLNGEPLVYAYPVRTPDERMIARIHVAATPLVGAISPSVELDPIPWDFAGGMRRACDVAVDRYPGWVFDRMAPVLHDGVRAGVMAWLRDARSEDRATVVIGLPSYAEAPVADDRLEMGWLDRSGYVSRSRLVGIDDEGSEALRLNWEMEHEWATRILEACSNRDWVEADLTRRPLGELTSAVGAARALDAFMGCAVDVAPVRKYFTAKVGYCTVGVARMIASRYNVYDSEKKVAGIMGIPHPNPGGSANWATAEEELDYYRDHHAGLQMAGSKVYDEYSFLKDWKNYRTEIQKGRPCNLRKWSIGSSHHSRMLGGIRVCTSGGTTKVRLGWLDPMHPETVHKQPQYWEKFDDTKLSSGGVVSTNLQIGGLVVVRS